MTKLVFCLRRRQGMSREEFQHYWREIHAPLVAGHAQTLGIRRYVQVHTTSDLEYSVRAARNGPEPYDGVAELWWDSADAMTAAASTEAGMAAGLELLEDERRFIDLEKSPLFFAQEHLIVGP
jgi:uncharacterized protein (TIGR02118 family)